MKINIFNWSNFWSLYKKRMKLKTGDKNPKEAKKKKFFFCGSEPTWNKLSAKYYEIMTKEINE